MVVVLHSETGWAWMAEVIEDLTASICRGQARLCPDGVEHALYSAYGEILKQGTPLRFDEVIQRGRDGGTTCRCYAFGGGFWLLSRYPSIPWVEPDAATMYASFTSPELAARIRTLTQHDGAHQLQALELHRSLGLPPESDLWMRMMFPNGKDQASLDAIEEQIRLYGYYNGVPF